VYGAIGRASSRGFDGGNNEKNNPIVLARTAVGISCPRVGDSARLEGARGGGFDDGETGCIWLQVYWHALAAMSSR